MHRLLRECGERCLAPPSVRRPFQVKATVIQRLSLSTDSRMVFGGVDLIQDGSEPCLPAHGISEREELGAASQRGSASQKDVLDVIKLKHGTVARGSLH